jgi:hypothetical protein
MIYRWFASGYIYSSFFAAPFARARDHPGGFARGATPTFSACPLFIYFFVGTRTTLTVIIRRPFIELGLKYYIKLSRLLLPVHISLTVCLLPR